MLHTKVVGLNVVNILYGIIFDVHVAYRKHLYFKFLYFVGYIVGRIPVIY